MLCQHHFCSPVKPARNVPESLPSPSCPRQLHMQLLNNNKNTYSRVHHNSQTAHHLLFC